MCAIVGVEVDLPAKEGTKLAARAVHRPLIQPAEHRSEARLGAVIAVDVEVVEEQEERTPRLDREPLEAPCTHVIGRAERGGRATALGAGRDHDVVLEASAQAKARSQEDPARPIRRSEFPLTQRLCEGRKLGGQRELVADHAVLAGVEAGEERSVRGERPRATSPRPARSAAPGGEPIQERRSRARIAVASEVIRAQGVDGDQQQIPRVRVLAATSHQSRDRQQQTGCSARGVLEQAEHRVAVLAARGSDRAA